MIFGAMKMLLRVVSGYNGHQLWPLARAVRRDRPGIMRHQVGKTLGGLLAIGPLFWFTSATYHSLRLPRSLWGRARTYRADTQRSCYDDRDIFRPFGSDSGVAG